MPFFTDVPKEPRSERVEAVATPEARNANPDELILPRGVREGREELGKTKEADAADARNDVRDGDLTDVLVETQLSRLERMKDLIIPREDRFEGVRGESLALPDVSRPNGEAAKQWLEEHGMRGIEYRNGYPDFSGVALESVTIPDMTTSKDHNFKQAYEATAEKWNAERREGRDDWRPSEVKAWKKENGLDIHEKEDLRTCEFVPHDVHMQFTHVGGRFVAALAGRTGDMRTSGAQQNKGGFYDQFDA
jgi:hypothetical protein